MQLQVGAEVGVDVFLPPVGAQVGVGCGDHSTAFPASLLSCGYDNDSRNEGRENGEVERAKQRDGVLHYIGCQ
eukprot:superscaffoldBa00001414_g10427